MTERAHKSTTHEEMFFHVFWDPSATARGYKGATVFMRREDTGAWWASVAFCSPVDQFNRRIGRQKARRRYFTEIEYGRWYIGLGPKPSYTQAELLASEALLDLDSNTMLHPSRHNI